MGQFQENLWRNRIDRRMAGGMDRTDGPKLKKESIRAITNFPILVSNIQNKTKSRRCSTLKKQVRSFMQAYCTRDPFKFQFILIFLFAIKCLKNPQKMHFNGSRHNLILFQMYGDPKTTPKEVFSLVFENTFQVKTI